MNIPESIFQYSKKDIRPVEHASTGYRDLIGAGGADNAAGLAEKPRRERLGTLHIPGSLDPCYASRLDGLVGTSNAARWIHGHTHRCCDYWIGDTRVINNGHGYGAENRGSYDPTLVVAVYRMTGPQTEVNLAGRTTV